MDANTVGVLTLKKNENMKTKEDYTVEFMRHGKVTVPKGTKVTHQTALGIDENYHFVDDLSWIPKDNFLLRHDVTYYGINVPKELISHE